LGWAYSALADNSRLTATVSLSDIFDSQRERSVIDSDVLHEITSRRNIRRAASIALSLPFCGKAATDTPFDFGN